MVSESEGVELPRCLRPAYHFTPAVGRVGDPNGLCWHDGIYHLFYLHFWKWRQDTGQSSWGHLVSEDMVRWKEAPTAFFPGEPYDSQACWSGCFRIIEGIPTISFRRYHASVSRALGKTTWPSCLPSSLGMPLIGCRWASIRSLSAWRFSSRWICRSRSGCFTCIGNFSGFWGAPLRCRTGFRTPRSSRSARTLVSG